MDQREYAEFAWLQADYLSDKRLTSQIPPLICKEHPLGKDEKQCHSEEEYKAIIKRYME